MKLFACLVATLAVALFLTTSCTAPGSRLNYDPDQRGAVKIATILPLTGQNAERGQRILAGAELAAEELSNGHGIQGRAIELLIIDTKSELSHINDLVAEAVQKGAVAAVAGGTADEVEAMADALKFHRLPAITPSATCDSITEQNCFLFRCAPTELEQGNALAAYAWYWRKKLRIGILMNMDPTCEYARGIARETAQTFKDLGGSVVRTEEYSGKSPDLEPALRALVAARPQAILLPLDASQSAIAVKIVRKLGYGGLLLGPDTWDDADFLKNCGSKPGDCAYIAYSSEKNKTKEYRQFVEKFQAKYSRLPGGLEAQGYDALRLTAIGLGNASSIEMFTRNLIEIRGYPGVAATYTFLPPLAELDRTMHISTIRQALNDESVPHSTNSRSFQYSRLETYSN